MPAEYDDYCEDDPATIYTGALFTKELRWDGLFWFFIFLMGLAMLTVPAFGCYSLRIAEANRPFVKEVYLRSNTEMLNAVRECATKRVVVDCSAEDVRGCKVNCQEDPE